MDERHFEVEIHSPENPGETGKELNKTALHSDRFADKFPVDPALIHETPMGGTLAAVGPMSGDMPDEIPMFETSDQEIPMGGTVAAVGPMEETTIPEVLAEEPPADETPKNKPDPFIFPVNEVNKVVAQEELIDPTYRASEALLTREDK
jgi:hypothetical protein